MTWSWERVVLVAARRGDRYAHLGTGSMIAPRRVLTARHVVFDKEGRLKPDLALRQQGLSDFSQATVTWAGDAGLDVAVLETDIEDLKHTDAMDLLSARNIDVDETWETKGYPIVNELNPITTLQSVRGKTCSYQKGHPDVALDVGARPENLRGSSGAPVVVNGRVIAVMRAVPENWRGERLLATPVAAFVDREDFRRALGHSPDADPLGATLSRLLEGVVNRLKTAPRVVRALALRLRVHDDGGDLPRTLASELVNARKAMDVAKELNHLDAELQKQNAERNDRDVVRTLLWQLLPFAIDFRRLVLIGRETLKDGASPVELPLHSETVAEVVLAGIDGRSCQFAPVSDEMPVGAALVRLPAAVYAPIFINEARLAQLVVEQLAADMKLTASYRLYPKLRGAVEGTLRYYAKEAPEDEILPYYLLFSEEPPPTGEAPGAKESDGDRDLWALTRRALGRELPSLRLVRLTGGAPEEETVLARHIERICKRTLS